MITVRFFASLRDAVGDAALTFDAEDVPSDLDALREQLGRTLDAGAFAAITADAVRVAVNQTLVEGNPPLVAGDEVAFLPPVTGG